MIRNGLKKQYGSRAGSKKNKKETKVGIFGTIIEKLGFGGNEKEKVSGGGGGGAVSSGEESAAEEISAVDVEAKLDALAAENPEKLDWKVSIVDLLELLDIDSSYAHPQRAYYRSRHRRLQRN